MPQKQKSAEEIIAEAKAAYKAAGGGQLHEYSNAPYSMAKPLKPEVPIASEAPKSQPTKPAQTGIKKEAADAGAAIAFRLKQQKALQSQ